MDFIFFSEFVSNTFYFRIYIHLHDFLYYSRTFLPVISNTNNDNETLVDIENITLKTSLKNDIPIAEDEIAVIEKLEPSTDIKIDDVKGELNSETQIESPETLVSNLESSNQ